jgi:NhaP-type Na+/H+ or K+/H+ antiporter
MIGINVEKIVTGIAFGVGLGFVNWRLMARSVSAADPAGSIRKSSFWRLLLIFIGLLAAIRISGAGGLVAAALSMLTVTWVGLWRIAKALNAQGGEKVER